MVLNGICVFFQVNTQSQNPAAHAPGYAPKPTTSQAPGQSNQAYGQYPATPAAQVRLLVRHRVVPCREGAG